MKFEINYIGHEVDARKVLLKDNIKTPQELAIMTARSIEDTINNNYVCYKNQDDWLLIPKGKEKEFNQIIKWITR